MFYLISQLFHEIHAIPFQPYKLFCYLLPAIFCGIYIQCVTDISVEETPGVTSETATQFPMSGGEGNNSGKLYPANSSNYYNLHVNTTVNTTVKLGTPDQFNSMQIENFPEIEWSWIKLYMQDIHVRQVQISGIQQAWF